MVLSITGSFTLSGQENPVKIGMLLPDLFSIMARDAAQLAIDQTNELRGVKGYPFELVVRTTEGPWGAGSKQSVNLVYEDSVCAFLGALDGRNAHLAEQVAVKAHVTYLETRATESTLSQAYVPWFFRCVPSDDQQSIAILEFIKRNDGGKLAILATEQNDSRLAARSFTRIAARKENNSPVPLIINPDESDIQQHIDQVSKRNIRHLIVTVHSPETLEIIELIRERMPEVMMYGTHSFTSGIDLQTPSWDAYEGMTLISAEILLTPEGKRFQESFQSKYGYKPGVSAFHAYDGTKLIIQAIQQIGLDREAIKDYIAKTRFSGWATGSISFDELGNRTDATRFTHIQK